MKKVTALLKKNREIIVYIVFGLLATFVNWVIYSFLVKLAKMPMMTSNALAWLGAVLFAFITNKIYVFQSNSKKVLREALIFFGSRFLSGVIEVVMPTFLFSMGLNHSIFGIKGFVAKIAVSLIVVILNYVTSKFIVFKSEPKGDLND